MNGGFDVYRTPTKGVPPAIQPEQEDAVHSEISEPPAERDTDESSPSVISARIDDAPATGPPAPEAAPIITTTLPSNSGGSSKRGVATTTARATSSSKKKKAAAQCRKGTHVKVTRSHLYHVIQYDVQREKLTGYRNSRNFFGQIL
jgi:hypothetical protein